MNRQSIRNLTILLGSTTTVLAATIISPALADMAKAFQAIPEADFLVRLTLTIPALFVAIGAPFAGILLDRWGRKPVIALGLILYGLAGTSGYFLDSLTIILLSRAILGLAVAGIMSGFTTLILDYFKGKSLNKFMGYQGAFIGLGGMAFLLAAGYLAGFSWRLPFLVHLFAFIVLPAVLLFLDEPKQKVNDTSLDDNQSKTSSLPLGHIIPIYFTAFIGMVIFFIFPVQLPFFFAAQGGISNFQVGLALSLQTLSSVFIALQYQRIKTHLSFQGIFAFIFLVLSINHAVVALTGNYWLVIIGLLIGGLGVGLMPPNNSIWLASVIPPEVKGRAVGGLTSALFLGQFFSPILTQPLIQRFNLVNTFGIASGLALALAIVFTMIAKGKGARSQSET